MKPQLMESSSSKCVCLHIIEVFDALDKVSKTMVSVLFCLVILTYERYVFGSVTWREVRVVGGYDTNITKIPYQLAMEYFGSPFCSATIIAETFALTASHCLERFSPREVTIRSGTSKRASGGDTFKIKNYTRNPKFQMSQLDYDIAVIELDKPITFNEFQKAAELDSQEPGAGENVTVSGWGRTSEKGSVAGNLQSTNVKVIDRDLCREYYKRKINITERMFCAGGEGQDSCGGDSGSPATNRGRLVGIVSWGLGCARQAYPGVYTNLMNCEIREFIRGVADV